MNFILSGLEQTSVDPDGRFATYRLADGSSFAVSTPPGIEGGDIPQATHRAAEAVRRAYAAVAVVDNARRQAAADETLSNVGRQKRVTAVLDAAQAEIAKAEQDVEALGRASVEVEAQAYAPPKLEAGDVIGALLDREIRDYALKLSGPQITAYAKTLSAEPAHLAAILRSPVPMGSLSDIAVTAWREHRAATPRGREAATYKAALDWAVAAVRQAKSKV